MKKWLCRLALLAAVISAFFGNFERHWHGDEPTVWNCLLSVLYLAAWGWFLVEKRSRKGLWFACIWWGMSLFSTVSWIGLQYLHFPEIFLVGAWSGAALCLSQLYGLKVLLRISYGGMYLVNLAICCGMLGVSIRKRRKLPIY